MRVKRARGRQAVLDRVAGAAAQRPLCRRGAAARLPLARRLQADRSSTSAFACWRPAAAWSISAARRAAGRRSRSSASEPGGGKVVGIDLTPIDADARRHVLQRRFPRSRDAPAAIREALGGPADLVLSDMAAPATGHAATDHLRIVALAEDGASTSPRTILAPGGAFVAKVFQGGAEGALLAAAEARLRRGAPRQAAGQPRRIGRDLRRRHRLPRRRIAGRAACSLIPNWTGRSGRPSIWRHAASKS